MRLLFLIITGLVVYGSLYPLAFEAGPVGGERMAAFLAFDPLAASRGDAISNLVLFGAFGLVGALAVGARRFLRLLLLGAGGLALAVALQAAQLYLPDRVPALGDVAWNAIGLAAGMVAGRIAAGRLSDPKHLGLVIAWPPAILLGAWIAYRLLPFVPALDWQSIKDSLKPLLLTPRLDGLGLLHDLTAWLVAFHLWRPAFGREARPWQLAALVGLIFLGEVLMVRNALSATNLLGAVLALSLWPVLSRRPNRALGLAALLAAMLLIRGLSPFNWHEVPWEFQFRPFAGALGGDMLVNLAAMTGKLFLYGALFWLLREAGLKTAVAATMGAVLLLAIEAAQTVIGLHTPEITDPLIFLLIALVVSQAERSSFIDGHLR